MNRRQFLWGLAGLAAGSAAYPLFSSEPYTRLIDDREYTFKEGLLQQHGEGDGKITLGVLGDLHADVRSTRFLTNGLAEQVDAFLLLGDLAYRYSENNHAQEIVDVMTPLANTGKLVLAMPGNHDTIADWKKAFDHLTTLHSNVIDLEQYPVVRLDDLTIVSLGGSPDAKRCVPGGFVREEVCPIYYNFMKCNPKKPILIATHVPKKYGTPNGLDALENGTNVGWEDLATVRYHLKSRFGVSAHMHEAAGIIHPDTEEELEPGKFYEALDMNPGPVNDHVGRGYGPSSGILKFEGHKAAADHYRRWIEGK